jgi:hypothetical protein
LVIRGPRGEGRGEGRGERGGERGRVGESESGKQIKGIKREFVPACSYFLGCYFTLLSLFVCWIQSRVIRIINIIPPLLALLFFFISPIQ